MATQVFLNSWKENMRARTIEKKVFATGFLAVVFATIVYSSALGLAEPLGEFIIWLAKQWPYSRESASYFVLLVLCGGVQLLFIPFWLTNTHVDRTDGRVRLRSDHTKESAWYVKFRRTLSLMELALMFIVAQAIRSSSIEWMFPKWVPDFSFPEWTPGFSLTALILTYFSMLVDYILLTAVIKVSIHSFFDLKIASLNTGNGFLGERKGTLVSSVEQCITLVIALPIWALLFGDAPFAKLLILCFLLLKLVFTGPFEIISLWLDRRNDLWVRSLAHQVTLDPDPNHRQDAAEKLGRLGRWAMPAKGELEIASKDIEERVRQSANAALAQISSDGHEK